MERASTGDRSPTAERILDVAEELIQSRGYSAFSYHDVSEAVGIRKASIHHHFPSKADLGTEVVARYAARFDAALASLSADAAMSTRQLLEHYLMPYGVFAGTADRVCLCGALAGEIMVLPEEMRRKVGGFFEDHQRWLAAILARGETRREVDLPAAPEETARLVFAALQGALLVKRTTGDEAQFADVARLLVRELTGLTPEA